MSSAAPSWPPASVSQSLTETSHDYVEANDKLQGAATKRLWADQIAVVCCAAGKGKPFSHKEIHALSELSNYLSSTYQAPCNERSDIIIIPQAYSRGPLNISLSGLQLLLGHTNASPAIASTLTAFSVSQSDAYIARNAVHFSPHAKSSTQPIEFTCLLRYVEKNDHKRVLTPWSIRMLGFYQQYDTAKQRETAILIHPSDATWARTKAVLKDSASEDGTWAHWTRLPLQVFASLLDGWQEYVTFLHDRVDEVEKDASFTNPKRKTIGEVSDVSLKECLAHIDVLRTASHALAGNIAVLEAVLVEFRRRKEWKSHMSTTEYDIAESVTEGYIREMTFTRNHVEHIRERWQQSLGAIRDLMSLRSAYNVERLSGRSLTEARAVRIITVVTLLYLPPTFAADFMDMNFIRVIGQSGGLLTLSVSPDFYMYLAIALPLIVVTLGCWTLWEFYSSRKERNLAVDIV